MSLGAAVEAITWLDGRLLVVKTGGQSGRIVVIRSDR
jgi:hypothetical protein